MRLASKIGIVTAAASGMGRAGALRFAPRGRRSRSSTWTRQEWSASWMRSPPRGAPRTASLQT